MGFLRRLVGGDKSPLPEWSPFDDGRTHQSFLDAVQADLRRRGVEHTMGDGFVDVESPETGHDVRLGLTNLAQSCALSPGYDWSSVISSHFDVVLKLDRAKDDAGRDFELARSLLRVRLVPDETMGGGYPEEWAIRRPAVGLLAMLALDLPDAVSIVAPSIAESWPVDLDGAYEIALANTSAEPAPASTRLGTEAEPSRIYLGESQFVASRALFLETIATPGTTDALVGIPNRHMLVLHEITRGADALVMPALAEVTRNGFDRGPGSISSSLYWWRQGDLVALPGWWDGDEYHVQPPDGFMELMSRLD